jgi:hypothetical protein
MSNFSFADLGLISVLQPSVGRDVLALLHAKAAGTLGHALEEKQIVPVGSLDRHIEARLQVGGARHVIDVAVGQPDLVDRDLGLSDRTFDLRQVASRINDHATLRSLAPQKGAVLLKRRDRNNEGFHFAHGYRHRAGTGLIWWMIAVELPLLARKMARRKQRWLAPREKCAEHELENSITCDISARKFLCNASGDAVAAPRRDVARHR